ncbi:MAG: chorismate synthase [Planctomycetes bacterium]|nr:chorismate synthase [Planctomycetota bacterium]
MSLTYSTAGESHGPGLMAMIEGLPAGLPIDLDAIRAGLARRWQGYGRGPRSKFEADKLSCYCGLKKGVTLGTPLVLLIENSDTRIDELPNLSAPRPGHVDMAGVQRLQCRDIRAVLERASARETAARTALGEVARQLLSHFNVDVQSQVVSVAGVSYSETAAWHAAIDDAKDSGDSLGGRFQVFATGVMPGLGSYAQASQRLDARLIAALASIPAIKAVSIGAGFDADVVKGSDFHDPIVADPESWGGIGRSSNNAGGVEGGLSNGQKVVLEAVIKPIPTLRKGLQSLDLSSMTQSKATYERSDVCVVEAAAMVAEALVALELAAVMCDRLSSTSLAEMKKIFSDLSKNSAVGTWSNDVSALECPTQID